MGNAFVIDRSASELSDRDYGPSNSKTVAKELIHTVNMPEGKHSNTFTAAQTDPREKQDEQILSLEANSVRVVVNQQLLKKKDLKELLIQNSKKKLFSQASYQAVPPPKILNPSFSRYPEPQVEKKASESPKIKIKVNINQKNILSCRTSSFEEKRLNLLKTCKPIEYRSKSQTLKHSKTFSESITSPYRTKLDTTIGNTYAISRSTEVPRIGVRTPRVFLKAQTKKEVKHCRESSNSEAHCSNYENKHEKSEFQERSMHHLEESKNKMSHFPFTRKSSVELEISDSQTCLNISESKFRRFKSEKAATYKPVAFMFKRRESKKVSPSQLECSEQNLKESEILHNREWTNNSTIKNISESNIVGVYAEKFRQRRRYVKDQSINSRSFLRSIQSPKGSVQIYKSKPKKKASLGTKPSPTIIYKDSFQASPCGSLAFGNFCPDRYRYQIKNPP